jgi:hypothetical protein
MAIAFYNWLKYLTNTIVVCLRPRNGCGTDRAVAQAPDSGCALPSEPEGIPAALDAAITGPADKDRACRKTLLIPEARMMFVSLGADGAPTYTLQTLDDWIADVKASGHALLQEKQLKFHIERYRLQNIPQVRIRSCLGRSG